MRQSPDHGVARHTLTAAVLAPALVAVRIASALLDPETFSAFIHARQGGRSLMVGFTALSSGYVLSRRHWSIAGAACALVALLGLSLLGFIGTMTAPLTTPTVPGSASTA